jgi:hypothetical protein
VAELKTKKTNANVTHFIDGIADDERRKDCRAVLQLMKQATGMQPKMWGTSIVGFGEYRYRYPSGQQGEWFLMGFSPRKDSLTLYCILGFPKDLSKLGKHKTGRSCLYIKRLADVDEKVLRGIIAKAAKKKRAPGQISA